MLNTLAADLKVEKSFFKSAANRSCCGEVLSGMRWEYCLVGLTNKRKTVKTRKWHLVVGALAVAVALVTVTNRATADPGGGNQNAQVSTENVVAPPAIPATIDSSPQNVNPAEVADTSPQIAQNIAAPNAAPIAINISPQMNLANVNANDGNAPNPNSVIVNSSPQKGNSANLHANANINGNNHAAATANTSVNLFEGANAVSKLPMNASVVNGIAIANHAPTNEGVNDVVFLRADVTVSSA